MNKVLFLSRIGFRRARLGVILAFALSSNAWAEAPETTTLDCGVNALFVLLQLEGRPVTLERLESVLPVRPPNGYSMTELASASRSLGLDLKGIRFAKGDKALTRPSIVFLKDGKGGHFAVLRPVGSTGKMVQVIDPPHLPWIGDYDRVCSAKSWTNRILTPREPWLKEYAVSLCLAVVGSALLVCMLAKLFQGCMDDRPNKC